MVTFVHEAKPRTTWREVLSLMGYEDEPLSGLVAVLVPLLAEHPNARINCDYDGSEYGRRLYVEVPETETDEAFKARIAAEKDFEAKRHARHESREMSEYRRLKAIAAVKGWR